MTQDIICKHCGENVGEFWSDLETHLWNKHREIISKWLVKQGKLQKSKGSK